jgi:hypothetical protein
MGQHERPEMSRPATEEEAFWINAWLHQDPHWFVPGELPLNQQEARWLVAYISRMHALFHPTMVQVNQGEQRERRFQVRLSYLPPGSSQTILEVQVQSLEDYTTLLRWAFGRDSCFERETEALSPEQRAAEEQRVFTLRRMIYASLGMFFDEPNEKGAFA